MREPWCARRSLGLVLFVGVAGGCSRGMKATTEPPRDSGTPIVVGSVIAPPAPTPSAPTPASASASMLPPIDAPIFPTPPTPPGANPLEVEIATTICKAAKLKKTIGCRSHPPFVTPAQMPDGTLPEFPEPDPLTFCAIDKLYPGSFTGPGKKQILVSFSPCKENDPDATWDMGFPGSGVVVEKTDGVHWRAVAYEGEVNLPLCKMSHLKNGDRDVLFCQSAFSAGAGTMMYFVHVDFMRAAPRKAATVAWIFNDEVHCGFMDDNLPGGLHLPGFAIAETKSFAITDVNGDGTPDLVIDVHRAALPPSSQLDATIRAACKKAGGNIHPTVSLIPKSAMQMTKIEIVSTGDSFAPSATSKKLLEDWEAVANSGATQLKGAAPPKSE